MTTLADVATLLREARHEADLSQEQLSKRAGVARTTLARMETLAISSAIAARSMSGEPCAI